MHNHGLCNDFSIFLAGLVVRSSTGSGSGLYRSRRIETLGGGGVAGKPVTSAEHRRILYTAAPHEQNRLWTWRWVFSGYFGLSVLQRELEDGQRMRSPQTH